MNNPDKNRRVVRATVEAIGLLGVIGSLIFVGIEVRQSAIATRAATDAAIAESFTDLSLMFASNPALGQAFVRAGDDPASASAEDQFLILGAWRALFHIWSNVHRQHLNGTVDQAIYESVVREISMYTAGATGELATRGAIMRWAWESERFLFNVDFQQFVDELIR